MATHIAYLCSGSIPSGTVGKGKFSLLGCDGSLPCYRSVTNTRAVLGLRMAEILEWSLIRGSIEAKLNQSQDSDKNDTSSGISFSSFFGLSSKGVSKSGKSEGLSSPLRGAHRQSSFDAISPEKALRVRVALVYPKLKFALWLADLVSHLNFSVRYRFHTMCKQGLTDAAALYAADARDVVRSCMKSGLFSMD